MNKLSLKDRLVRYFKNNHSLWIKSGDLQRIVAENTTYSPQNVGRRLRELVEENEIEVRYVRGAAQYRLKEKVFNSVENKRLMEFFDNYATS